MSRTTSAAVEELLADHYNGRTNVKQFIDSATVVVSRVITCASNKQITISSAEAELIERWLAAHMYHAADLMYANKSTGGASAGFQGQTGMMLEGTHYGQNALMIDPSGCLKALMNGGRIMFKWLGKTKGEQLTYDERNPSA